MNEGIFNKFVEWVGEWIANTWQETKPKLEQFVNAILIFAEWASENVWILLLILGILFAIGLIKKFRR